MRHLVPGLVALCLVAACEPKAAVQAPAPAPSPTPAGLKYTPVSFGVKAQVASGAFGTVETVTGVQMVDATTGYAVGGPRVVLKTTDGGQSWAQSAGKPEETNLTRNAAFTDLAFIDALHGFILAGSECFRTADGGTTWTRVPEFTLGHQAVQFFGPTDGVAVGPGSILRTTDGGLTWQDDRKDAAGQVMEFDTISDLGSVGGRPTFLGAKGKAPILMTRRADGWQPLKLPKGDKFFAFGFRDDQNGWLANTILYKTFDGADTWIDTVTDAGFGAGTQIRLLGDAEAWVASATGVAMTITGGVRWTKAAPIDPENPPHSVYQTSHPVGHGGFQVVGPNNVWLANGTRALYHFTGN
ncbi:MAG: uncharacterized protein JWM80_6571 [Cyanobacteria bacterium RYN_339]|nr:uncharacterized protein [Cyanobacteria bacterium RYN_339]